MRKDEIAKLETHIRTTLMRQISLTGIGFQTQYFLNAVFVLYQSRIISYKDFANLNFYIISIADDYIKNLPYERLKNENETL